MFKKISYNFMLACYCVKEEGLYFANFAIKLCFVFYIFFIMKENEKVFRAFEEREASEYQLGNKCDGIIFFWHTIYVR